MGESPAGIRAGKSHQEPELRKGDSVRMYKAILLASVSLALFAQMPIVEGAPGELAAIRYIDIKPGDGVPYAAGKHLTVHYTGWLRDGTKFDSSVDRNRPFDFVQGRRQVITGWDVGFEG